MSSIDFVGYPYIVNDTIKRIYVYFSEPFNAMQQGDRTTELFENQYFHNAIDSVTNSYGNVNCSSITVGYYPIYQAEGLTDYIYIDLEERMDLSNL